MQVFSTFNHSIYLELAIVALERSGIPKSQILAIPLEVKDDHFLLFDSIHQSDSISLFDIAAGLATAFAVIGVSVGFILTWGPIYWGLIGAASGFIIGFLINFIYYRVVKKRSKREQTAEVILIVECIPEQTDRVIKILKTNFSKGLAVLS
ncbi:hypothetical protein MKZ18_14045 [Priestia sp. FSL W8-0001]|uniref:hypothetical protein n=1 Tax=Priestia sp. FSL W8-0001 TaxID=2921708 RepID=UPI0030FD694B